MSLRRRVGLAAALLALGLVSGCGGGTTGAAAGSSDHGARDHNHGSHDHGSHGHEVTGDGLSPSLRGYTLDDLQLDGGRLTFRILGPAGRPHTSFAVTHRKRLHMFVISEDLSDFQHVHPTMDRSGRWSLDLPRVRPGRNHVVTEFTAEHDGAQEPLMLGGDVRADGTSEQADLPEPTSEVTVDGYTVELTGVLLPGRTTQLDVRITDAEGRVPRLRPYLASWSHAALVHAGSLALTHMHPIQEWSRGASSPEDLDFNVTTLQPGAHRLVVEFRTATGLHQAELTVTTT